MAALGLHVDRDGDVPVGTQIAWQIQTLITSGRLLPGERLPSVRKLAEVAGVHVNTVRSVYERLEGEGFVRTEHGRGSFVAENVPQLDPRAERIYGESPSRGDLKEQISALEAQLSKHVTGPGSRASEKRARVLSTEELAEVRDELAARLEQIDAMRDDLVGLLASLRIAMGEDDPASASPARSPSAADGRRAPRRRKSLAPRPSESP